MPYDEARQVDPQMYLHRSGRSGRFGKKGITLNLIDSPKEKRDLDEISEYWKKPITQLDPNDLEESLSAALKKL